MDNSVDSAYVYPNYNPPVGYQIPTTTSQGLWGSGYKRITVTVQEVANGYLVNVTRNGNLALLSPQQYIAADAAALRTVLEDVYGEL